MSELANKFYSFNSHNLWITRSYKVLTLEIEEKLLVVKVGAPLGFLDEVDITSSLLNYINASISFLNTFERKIPVDKSHLFLRYWRNAVHHHEYVPFVLSTATERESGYYLAIPAMSLAKLARKEVEREKDPKKKEFKQKKLELYSQLSESDGTLNEILIRHHQLILEELRVVKSLIQAEMDLCGIGFKFAEVYHLAHSGFASKTKSLKDILAE